MQQLEEYLHQVKAQLKSMSPQKRNEELQEIRQHLLALVATNIERGVAEEKAVSAALRQFGDSKQVGRSLHRASGGFMNQKSQNMKSVFSMLLGLPAVWLLSALLHSMDPDINGLAGLTAPGILLSVTTISLLLYIPVLVPLIALRLRGSRAYWASMAAVSCAVGVMIAAAGSGATDAQGRMVSFVGVTLICTAVFIIATLPSVLWRNREARLPNSQSI